ncbi:MAG: hypothetical protein M1814_003934 [Vezdaea aestivalis]|nr:MAG: hypothetical protein M1814_003934 [Vezdaea aestivalis]
MEVTNVISHPSGPDYQFTAGEDVAIILNTKCPEEDGQSAYSYAGTYKLKDDLQLSTPPPHPSEAQPPNVNPLATNPSPPATGTRLSLITINPKSSPPPIASIGGSSSAWSIGRRTHSIKESAREGRSSSESTGQRASSDAAPPPLANGGLNGISRGADGHTQLFGDSNALLAPPSGKDALKRRKPKNNIVKSNSSFVSRVVPHEHFPKKATDRDHSQPMVFSNINRGFQWLDFGAKNLAEYLTKILFTKAHALCHDVNHFTKSVGHLDVILGFSTGDIIWYEAMSQKYARLNKTHAINTNPILDIRWIPGSENLFLAAHSDGALVVYDKEKEDVGFVAEDQAKETLKDGSAFETHLEVKKSVNSKNQKTNPVAYWQISNQQINAISFSPDDKLLAVVSEDGSLRVLDIMKEK